MKEWRGVIVQLWIFTCLTMLAMRSSNEFVLHTVVGALGATSGHALSRARTPGNDSGSGSDSGGGSRGRSVVPPGMGGAITGFVLAIGVSFFVMHA